MRGHSSLRFVGFKQEMAMFFSLLTARFGSGRRGKKILTSSLERTEGTYCSREGGAGLTV